MRSVTAELSAADMSLCRAYRYRLWRRWHTDERLVNWIMLNPSIADATVDDPTIRRCMRFARNWGYGGIVVTNLFAFRATNPCELRNPWTAIGKRNDDCICYEAKGAALVVCAWGNMGRRFRRSAAVVELLSGIDLYVLALTGQGEPVHPLYQRASAIATPWAAMRAAAREETE